MANHVPTIMSAPGRLQNLQTGDVLVDPTGTPYSTGAGGGAYVPGGALQWFEFGSSNPGYVNVPNHSSFNNTDKFTVSMWFYEPYSAPSLEHGLFYKGDYAASWGIITIFTARTVDSEQAVLWFKVNNNTLGMTPNIRTQTWWHLVATFDSVAGMVLYLNGVQIQTASTGAALTADSSDIKIGTWYGDANTRLWKGYIDDVRFYHAVLTPTQALALYNGGVGTATDANSPLFWLKFDDGLGQATPPTTAADSSGNGHTASLINGPAGYAPVWARGIVTAT